MKNIMKALTVLALVAIVAVLLVPMSSANAASGGVQVSVTITQDQINDSYRVTNPVNRAVTDVHVIVGDPQGDQQVTIAATITRRGKKPVQTVSTWVPVIRSGMLFWKLTGATYDGTPATPAQLAEMLYIHRYGIYRAIRRDIERHLLGRYVITSVAITEGAITINATVYGKVPTPATPAATAQ